MSESKPKRRYVVQDKSIPIEERRKLSRQRYYQNHKGKIRVRSYMYHHNVTKEEAEKQIKQKLLRALMET
jgi:hypothetical protein